MDFSWKQELLRALIQVTPVVLGWLVVHKLSVARERDKARREVLAKSVDSLNDELSKIFALALDYHGNERVRTKENAIKMNLQDISERTNQLAILTNEGALTKFCKAAVLSLKKSITGSHFEDEHLEKIDLASEQIQLIAAEVLKAKRAFLRLKHSQFTEI